MRRSSSTLVRLAALAVAALVLFTACAASAETAALPDIELERLNAPGNYTVDGPGEARVLNLWATWCAPCRAELPAFDAVAARSEIEIIGVNVGDTGDDAGELVAELGLTFPQVLDPKASVQRALKITGMPATIFVDPAGEVLSVHNGELTEDELIELLDEFYGLDSE